jgi:transcriptional regulator with XRE-family HTH domain
MMNVAERILTARKKAGLTQMEVANRVGVSFQAISNWERGVSMPDISNLEPLAKVLGMTVDDIICDPVITSIITNEEIPEEISPDQFNAVSPLLMPETNIELLKRVENNTDKELNIESLCKGKSEIEKMVTEAYEDDNVTVVSILIGRCSEAFISDLAERAYAQKKAEKDYENEHEDDEDYEEPDYHRTTGLFSVIIQHDNDTHRQELYRKAVKDRLLSFIAILEPYIG